jgi:hypothetical protein
LPNPPSYSPMPLDKQLNLFFFVIKFPPKRHSIRIFVDFTIKEIGFCEKGILQP